MRYKYYKILYIMYKDIKIKKKNKIKQRYKDN